MQRDGISTTVRTGFWPRGAEVSISDGKIRCALAFHSQYDLVKSRSYSPHIKFLNARTDQELLNFVRTWGPLYIVHGAPDMELERGISVRPVSEYRAFQRLLRALVNLLLSCGEGRLDGRKCLVEFLAAENELCGFSTQTGEPPMNSSLRRAFCRGMNPSEWIAQSSESQVRNAVAFVLQVECSAIVRLSVEHDGKQFQIEPKWQICTLQEALRWIVWNERVASCQECGEIFAVTSYRWKYHSEECAHRATDRAWRANKRREEKNQITQGE
jgi:hypothetical protein